MRLVLRAFSRRQLVPVALVLALVVAAVLPTVATADPFALRALPDDIVNQADTIIDGQVIGVELAVLDTGMFWSVATVEVDTTLKGAGTGQVTVAWRGGTDPATGAWQRATHTTQLSPGDQATLALTPAPAELDAAIAAASTATGPVQLVVGGERGTIVSDGVDVQFELNNPLSVWEMPIPYRVNPNVNTLLLGNAAAVIDQALGTIEDDPGSAIRFSYQGTSSSASIDGNVIDNTIFAGPAPGTALGIAVFGGDGNGRATGFMIILDSTPQATLAGGGLVSVPWADTPRNGNFNLETTVMHEMGHVLGLAHSPVPGAVMVAAQTSGFDPAVLGTDDQNALAFLYPDEQGTCAAPGPGAIVGTAGPDQLVGTAGPDLIAGLGGDDTLSGLGGDDTLCGGAGRDTLAGGDGNDVLYGGNDDDALWGQGGNDMLFGQSGNDRLRGGAGNDVLDGADGADDLNGGRDNDVLRGGNQDDELRGGTGDDNLDAGAGNDFANGNGGVDRVQGGAGNDEVLGGPRPDELRGGSGNDVLRGLGGADSIFGDDGNDTLLGGRQQDAILDGGVGVDTCNGQSELTQAGAARNCETVLNTVG